MGQLIYAVEDDESLRELISYALSGEGFRVQTFERAEDMLKAAEKALPSLVILDIMLPGMDGITALKKIRQKYKGINIKVLMLTAKDSEISKVVGLDSGADDYITKPFSVLELIARVKAHLRKYSVLVENEELVYYGLKLNPRSHTLKIDQEEVHLTGKEFQLLHLLMSNIGVVLPREKIMQQVWGYDYIGESRTIDIHITNLRNKLKEYGSCIVGVRGIGYTFKESKDE